MSVIDEIKIEVPAMAEYDINESDMRNYYSDKIRQKIEQFQRKLADCGYTSFQLKEKN